MLFFFPSFWGFKKSRVTSISLVGLMDVGRSFDQKGTVFSPFYHYKILDVFLKSYAEKLVQKPGPAAQCIVFSHCNIKDYFLSCTLCQLVYYKET